MSREYSKGFSYMLVVVVVVYDLRVLKHYGPKKIIQEKLIKFINILNYIKSSKFLPQNHILPTGNKSIFITSTTSQLYH